jgi:hypothetical protein
MGTLRIPHTCSWPTTAASRTQAGAAPGPRPRPPDPGHSLQVGAVAEVVLDLHQQLHGGVGGGHPPGWAVGMDQGEAGPVDLKNRSGCLGHPEQPSQQVIGFGQGHPELLDGPGDHLTVNSHSLILVLRATTKECFHRRAAPATPSGERPNHPITARHWTTGLLPEPAGCPGCWVAIRGLVVSGPAACRARPNQPGGALAAQTPPSGPLRPIQTPPP